MDKAEVLITRARLLKNIRNFLDERGYVEVETPVLRYFPSTSSSDKFLVDSKYNGHTYNLRCSPEKHLIRLARFFDKFYEIGKCFRNERPDFDHSPEFTMLEFYERGKNYEQMINLTERLISETIRKFKGSFEVNYRGKRLNFQTPWPRIRVRDYIMENYGLDPLEANVDSLRSISDSSKRSSKREVLSNIITNRIENDIVQPTFITDFPREVVTHGKPKSEDLRLIEGAEVFVFGGLEIASVGSVNVDYNSLMQHFNKYISQRFGDSSAKNIDTDLLEDIKQGLPEMAGTGIGIDRLMMLLLGGEIIDKTQAFEFRR